MPTEYTLTYFDIRGYAEPARMILAYGGAVWKDNRVQFFGPGKSPIPGNVKNRSKYGQLPLLEFAGKRLVQSTAIARYLAQEFRLTGKDSFEAALCDEFVDTVRDVFNLFLPHFGVADEAKKSELFQQGYESAQQRFMGKIEEAVKQNGGHLVGSSLTWADIVTAHYLDQIRRVAKVDLTEGHPAIARLLDTVFEAKGIKEYIAQRPETAL